jgi:tetratricopeptide (TPR) repeat protein
VPDFDRHWYLAALAIVEGSRQSDLIDQFVKVARTALPNESALDLSRAFAIELRFPDRQLAIEGTVGSRATVSSQTLITQTTANRPPTPLPDLAPRREPDLTLLEARDAFERLRDRPLVDAEATLRMGRVAARLRENDTAVKLLGSVPRLTSEPDLVHLSHLFQGEIYQRTGRTREAVAAYRAALTAVPRARTAAQMLADLLLETSERQEGTVLAADARTYSASVDPWYRYMDGSMRKWPERVARLRESLDK